MRSLHTASRPSHAARWRGRSPLLALPPALLTVLISTAPDRASACGGTFCDAGPQAMPVDQTGENILFVVDGPEVEAHIQIQYDPDTPAEDFAWLIPLTAVPEFAIGSQPLFDSLLAGTVPTYSLSTTQCFDGGSNTGGCEFICEADMGASQPEPEPEIVWTGTVGAFDITVLDGESVPGLMQWLGDNGYQQDEAAAPILQQYLDEGHLFAAFKLTHGAGVSEIHPIALRFSSAEPCIPLRLTRIAAQDDMEIRAFFLGSARTVPSNYRHVLVNPLKLDWLNLADNYKEVISQAVDAFPAEGNAFVTEYAGSSDVVPTGGIFSDEWDESVFIDAPPGDALNLLHSMGLLELFGQQLVYRHPQLRPLLLKHLPPPDGLDPDDFYYYLSEFKDQIDHEAWGDGAGFAQDLLERIIEPGERALDLVETWPYLTRMYTTISPSEMNEDPIFMQNPELPDVAALQTAQRDFDCELDGASIVTLPDGREVYIPSSPGTWPEFPDEMPWTLEVQQATMVGAPQVLLDNAPIIDTMLDAWNHSHGWPQGAGTTGGSTGTGGDSMGSGGDDDDDSDESDSGSGSATDSRGATDTGEAGCGCRSDALAPSRGPGHGLGLALLLLATRRRRR